MWNFLKKHWNLYRSDWRQKCTTELHSFISIVLAFASANWFWRGTRKIYFFLYNSFLSCLSTFSLLCFPFSFFSLFISRSLNRMMIKIFLFAWNNKNVISNLEDKVHHRLYLDVLWLQFDWLGKGIIFKAEFPLPSWCSVRLY